MGWCQDMEQSLAREMELEFGAKMISRFPMSRSWGHDFPFRTLTGCEVSVLQSRTTWLGNSDFPKSLSVHGNSMSTLRGFHVSSSWETGLACSMAEDWF